MLIAQYVEIATDVSEAAGGMVEEEWVAPVVRLNGSIRRLERVLDAADERFQRRRAARQGDPR